MTTSRRAQPSPPAPCPHWAPARTAACVQCQVTPPGALPDARFWRATRETFYYYWLNQDPAFQAALQTLLERVRPHLTPKILAPPETVYRMLLDFAAEWWLPGDAARDALWLCLLRVDHGFPLELVQNDHAYSTAPAFEGPTVHVGDAERLVRDPSGKWVWMPEPKPTIEPEPPQPFAYDPRKHTDADLNAYAEQEAARVRASILAQAGQMKQLARERGGQRRSPRYYSADEILRLARRFYLAVVCRLPWEAIADDEERAGHDRPEVKSVKATVREWARDFGIILPPRKVGRPRKTD